MVVVMYNGQLSRAAGRSDGRWKRAGKERWGAPGMGPCVASLFELHTHSPLMYEPLLLLPTQSLLSPGVGGERRTVILHWSGGDGDGSEWRRGIELRDSTTVPYTPPRSRKDGKR